MYRRCFAVALLVATSANWPALAATKCTVNGKVVYQDTPCEGGASVNLSGAGAADPTSPGTSYLQREGRRIERQEKEQEAANLRAERVTIAIGQKKVMTGMTAEEVRRSWGEPTRINSSVGSYGRHEQWVYGSGGDTQYLYLDNGVLRSMQSPN